MNEDEHPKGQRPPQGWPSHARLSIAFRANSHSRWDPVNRAALPFALAQGRSWVNYWR